MRGRVYELTPDIAVSMAEMNHNPKATIEIVHDWHGWEIASRLYQQWKQNLPDMGLPGIEAQFVACRIQDWLEARRPAQHQEDA